MSTNQKSRELKLIFWLVVSLFAVFLIVPLLILLAKSLWNGGFTLEFFKTVVGRPGFSTALGNSLTVASLAAVIATVIAFLWPMPCIIQRCQNGLKD